MIYFINFSLGMQPPSQGQPTALVTSPQRPPTPLSGTYKILGVSYFIYLSIQGDYLAAMHTTYLNVCICVHQVLVVENTHPCICMCVHQVLVVENTDIYMNVCPPSAGCGKYRYLYECVSTKCWLWEIKYIYMHVTVLEMKTKTLVLAIRIKYFLL